MLLKAYINRLDGTPLFFGIDRESFEDLLDCLSAETVYIEAGELLKETEGCFRIGVLLSGEACVIRTDSSGKQTVINELGEGDVFGEVIACAKLDDSSISVLARHSSAIMMLDYQKIMTLCPEACSAQMLLIGNLMRLMARRSLLLERRLEALEKRTIKEKLICFLEIQREMAGEDTFVIPYSREGLSEYLCVDRSALSRELSKLKDEGYIDFKKNIFTLKMQADDESE